MPTSTRPAAARPHPSSAATPAGRDRSTGTAGAYRRTASRASARRRLLGLLYLAPALVVYAVVTLVPAGQGVWLSFWHWDGVTPATWAGFANYTGFFTDPRLRQALDHTGVFLIFFSALPIALGLLSAALTARREVRGAGMYRWVIFLPQMLTPAVTAVVWKRIYAPDGPVNLVLRDLGLGSLAHGWLGDYTWALPALGLVGTWTTFGLCMVLLVAGMQNIPTELYDAARVDGAGPVREFFSVTLPGLRGHLAVALTLSALGALRVFDIVWLTNRGGPGTSTITPAILLYERAFTNPDIGAAAAIGVVLAVVSLLVTLCVAKLSEEKS
ncbi:carbohydrate ABC transporter permease [Streptomyces odontomachi]|uniref:carbohydrate ABC transporter permease n=1 Tax=Streptomyces odontomachi TaxID=2944940 RepID=UPI00210C4315|nr:sugar ABC transporter permease [Streptomyces sp. ODS25]